MATYSFDAVVTTGIYDPATETTTHTDAGETVLTAASSVSSDSLYYSVREEFDSGAFRIGLYGIGGFYHAESPEFSTGRNEPGSLSVYLYATEWEGHTSIVLVFRFSQYDKQTETYHRTQFLVHAGGDALPPITNIEEYEAFTSSITGQDGAIPEGMQEGDVIALSDIGNGRMTEVDNFSGSAVDDVVALGAGDDWYNGLAGDDMASGGDGNDVLFGGAGDDRLNGGSGDDQLNGGIGADTLTGFNGRDILRGGGGADTINGGKHTDKLYGNQGDDTMLGGSGNDLLYGGLGHDVLRGGFNHDRLFGGAGNDRLHGDNGVDRLFAGEGDDWLFGGAGNDRLIGAAGSDDMRGGSGADTFVFDGAAMTTGQDRIHDWTHADTIELSGVTADDVTVFATTQDTIIDYGNGNVITVIGVTDTLAVMDSFEFV